MANLEKHTITRVYNLSGTALPVGFLGYNGVTIAASGYYDHRGILENDLNQKEEQALQTLVDAGTLSLLHIDPSYTDGLTSPAIIIRKAFGTGPGTTAIYSSNLPAKLRIINGHVVITAAGAWTVKGTCNTHISVTNGTNAILKKRSIALTAAGDTDIVNFLEIDDAYQTLATGASLIVALTGTTGMPAGVVYVTAIRVT